MSECNYTYAGIWSFTGVSDYYGTGWYYYDYSICWCGNAEPEKIYSDDSCFGLDYSTFYGLDDSSRMSEIYSLENSGKKEGTKPSYPQSAPSRLTERS